MISQGSNEAQLAEMVGTSAPYISRLMDIYAMAKYNRPEELSEVVNSALKLQADSDES